ncbi:unnamed protein product [Periconia digitata]|uniref:Secreted protein n=1 Tax=Periconia digitata TaxID=1303443 RepID=A0A9W4UXS6_9PLEO|nr:unnamed protein product [Periconia digitata]
MTSCLSTLLLIANLFTHLIASTPSQTSPQLGDPIMAQYEELSPFFLLRILFVCFRFELRFSMRLPRIEEEIELRCLTEN